MNIDAAIPLAAGLTACSLAAILFLARGSSRAQRALAFFCCAAALWNLSQFMLVGGWAPGWAALWQAGRTTGFVLTAACLVTVVFPLQLGGRRLAGLEPSIFARQADQMRRYLRTAAELPEPGVIKEQLRGFLVEVMGARRYQVYLRDEPGFEFPLFDGHPPRTPAPGEALKMDSPVIRAFLAERPEYLRLATGEGGETRSELQSAACDQLRGWGTEWCFPLFSGTELLGLLALGLEAGSPSYDEAEVKLLVEFSRDLAVLTHKLSLADELELIGRMSRGMAHDLKDLLTPIKTLVQLMEEDGGARPRLRELLPVAARNLEAVQAYVDEALFFSRNRAPSIHPARLDHILQKVVLLAAPRGAKKGVRVMLSPLTAQSAEVDETLVLRMLSNILSNAIDASEPNGKVEIELLAAHKEPDGPPWARVRVLDWGAGMNEEGVQKLLRSRFTTKPGRGAGLGFAIARKIVLLHGGQISVFSEENVGTCVEIDLPGRSRVADAAAVIAR